MLHSKTRATLLGALAAILMATGADQAAAAPVTVSLLPTSGPTTTVQRVAPLSAGGVPTWRANVLLSVHNTSSSMVTVDRVDVTLGDSTWSRTTDFNVAAGATKRLQVLRSFTGHFPLPASATTELVVVDFGGLIVSHPLAVHRNETPTGAYKFPYKQADFPTDTYVATQETQGSTSHHFSNTQQFYAHDMGARRFDGKTWTSLKPGGNESVLSDWLIYNRPLYAVDEGTIIACRRTMEEQPIGTPSTTKGGGNFIHLRTGSGETVAYGHLRTGTIPLSLCPVESRGPDEPGGARAATPVAVKAGQLLGRTGNSGGSYAPHVHIEVFRGTLINVNKGGSEVHGVPMHFDRYETVQHFDSRTSGTVAFGRVAEGQGAAMPEFALTRAHHPCGWEAAPRGGAEWITVRSPGCFQEGFNDTVNYGYAPVELEGASDNTVLGGVFRPSSFATVARYGLLPGTGSGSHQAALDTFRGQGYSLQDVDSYVTTSGIRYAAVWTRQALGATIAYHGATAAQHQSQFNQATSQGYRPVTITVARVGSGAPQFTAVYRKVGDGAFVAEFVRESDFQARFDQRTREGFRPVFVDGYNDNGTPTFSVIWTKGASGTYVMRSSMTLDQLRLAATENVNAGRPLRSLTAYRSGGIVRYAAIWR